MVISTLDRTRTCKLAHWFLKPTCIPVPPQGLVAEGIGLEPIQPYGYWFSKPGRCHYALTFLGGSRWIRTIVAFTPHPLARETIRPL